MLTFASFSCAIPHRPIYTYRKHTVQPVCHAKPNEQHGQHSIPSLLFGAKLRTSKSCAESGPGRPKLGRIPTTTSTWWRQCAPDKAKPFHHVRFLYEQCHDRSRSARSKHQQSDSRRGSSVWWHRSINIRQRLRTRYGSHVRRPSRYCNNLLGRESIMLRPASRRASRSRRCHDSAVTNAPIPLPFSRSSPDIQVQRQQQRDANDGDGVAILQPERNRPCGPMAGHGTGSSSSVDVARAFCDWWLPVTAGTGVCWRPRPGYAVFLSCQTSSNSKDVLALFLAKQLLYLSKDDTAQREGPSG